MTDAILTNTMLPELSIELLNRLMGGAEVKEIEVTVEETGLFIGLGEEEAYA